MSEIEQKSEADEIGTVLLKCQDLARVVDADVELSFGDGNVRFTVTCDGKTIKNGGGSVLSAVQEMRAVLMTMSSHQLPKLEKEAIRAVEQVSALQAAMGQNGTQRAEAAKQMRKAMGQ